MVTTEQDLKPVKVIGSPKLQPPVHSGVGDAREPPLPRHEASLLHFAVMPHDHQMYAATWAIMSVVTAIMARMVLRKNGRRVFNFGRS